MPLLPVHSDAAAGSGDQQEVEMAPNDNGEGTSSVAMKQPVRPTRKMIEDHEVSHIPFRDWCSACVRGRAKSCQHRRSDKAEALSTFSVDYGFFGTPSEAPLQAIAGKDLPVLVGKDRQSGAIYSHPVPHKGLQPTSTP